jgi:DNA-binding response OmpR family regulator
MRILIIDDEENIRRATVVVLEAIGHETVSVESAGAALKQLESGSFDIAFLDLKLVGESGLDAEPVEGRPEDLVVVEARGEPRIER